MVHAKRIAVIGLLVIVLFVIALTSDQNVWNTTPSTDTILDSIELLQNRKATLEELRNDSLERNPKDEFNILFDNHVRHTFIIEFTQAEFDALVLDMKEYYIKYGNYKSNAYHNVSVIYIADNDIQVLDNVGFRTKGNIYSRRLPVDEYGNVREVHFMLKFNEVFDYSEGTDQYNQLKTREWLGLEQLLFKWNNTLDPSYTNEVYSYQLFEDAGVVVPKASYAEVQIVIDGKVELVSFYNIFEHYDEEFIRRTFNEEGEDDVGDLYKGQWSGTLMPITSDTVYGVRDWETNYRPLYSKETNKDVENYQSLIDFSIGINDQNIARRKLFIKEHFAVDMFLKTMALNVLLGNPDDYRGNGNNFYYYFNQDGYLTYIPFDYDNSMGSGWDGAPAFIDYTLGNDIYTWGWFDYNPFTIPLWDNIIYYEDYQIAYENYLESFITSGLYSEVTYRDMVNTIQNLYGEQFLIVYDKQHFFEVKTQRVLEQVAFYREQRES